MVLSPFDTSCDARVDSLESFWVNEAIAGYRLPDCSFVWETDINLLKPKADLKLVNGLVLQKV